MKKGEKLLKFIKIFTLSAILVCVFLLAETSKEVGRKSESAMKEEIYKDPPAKSLRERDVLGIWAMLVPNAKYKDWTKVSMLMYFTFEKDNVVEYYPHYEGIDAKGKKVKEDVPNVFGSSIYLLINKPEEGDLLKVGIFSDQGKDLSYLYFRKKEDKYFLGCNIQKHVCGNTLALYWIGDLSKKKK